ncbi:MAG: hypothetical protein PUG67_06480 [Peptoniphilaceae bacterium]|nr:hypothetical protein [Peptoniphilaceae bacterium]MDY6019651.1 hypothetical protein [Anaerococcus sp.]
MKINKKVVAATLALSMGLGVVAPTAKSFADTLTTTVKIDLDKYKLQAESWLNTYKELKTLKDTKSDLLASKNSKILEKADLEEKISDNKEQIKALDAKAYEDTKALKEEYKDKIGKESELEAKIAEIEKKAEDDKVLVNARIISLNRDLEKTEAKLAEINTKLKKDYTYKDKDDKEAKAGLDEAISELEKLEASKKEAFIKVGGTKEAMEAMIKAGKIILPETKEEKERKEIEQALKRLEDKLSGLKVIKKHMPESYKKYKKVLDEAEKSANYSIKLAKDYLEKNK